MGRVMSSFTISETCFGSTLGFGLVNFLWDQAHANLVGVIIFYRVVDKGLNFVDMIHESLGSELI